LPANANGDDVNESSQMPRVTPPKRDPRYPDFPTIVHALAYAAEHRGQAPALACLDREITYAQYAQAVAALARRFGEAGVVVGERIAYPLARGCFGASKTQLTLWECRVIYRSAVAQISSELRLVA
jgi:hypothetical protein